ncbi:MAG: hypothetical protein AAF965_09405 [Pseudomonadota bacterium]
MTDDDLNESKRGRVRRLLIDPLTQFGFRRSAKIPADKHEKTLTAMIDDLTYMADPSLNVLAEMLRGQGQGKARDVWPSRATVVGFAELIEPRPIEELPALLRWFKSVEGPKARDAGTLVETWMYFQKHKRPPFNQRMAVERAAEDNRRELSLKRDRIKRGVAQDGDADWVQRYEARLAYCLDIVKQGEAQRDEVPA